MATFMDAKNFSQETTRCRDLRCSHAATTRHIASCPRWTEMYNRFENDTVLNNLSNSNVCTELPRSENLIPVDRGGAEIVPRVRGVNVCWRNNHGYRLSDKPFRTHAPHRRSKKIRPHE